MENSLDAPSKRFTEALNYLKKNLIIRAENSILTGTDFNKSVLSDIKAGRQLPSEEILEILRSQYGISTNWIMQGVGDMLISNTAEQNNDDNQRVTGDINSKFIQENKKDLISSQSPLKSNAVFIGSFDIDDETMKTKSGNEFISLGGGAYIMVIPLVTEYAYNGYLLGFSDPQYLETLPKTYLPVTELHKGVYRSFETRNDSMDDGTSQSIEHGDTAVGRLISPDLYRNSKLHLKKYPDYIIVTDNGIIVKRIIEHNPETGEIVIHSLNPDKDRYPDLTMHLRDVKQLFNVTNVMKSRR